MKNMTVWLTAFALASALPAGTAAAASMEITAAIQTSLDKTIAGASPSQARTIQSLYSEFLRLQKQDQDWERTIDALHDRNKDTAAAISKNVKEIDAAKISKMEAEIKQTRERYEPLLSRYTSLNKQIDAARALKSKSLNTLLNIQVAALKIPVQLARADIAAKVMAHQAAKDKVTQASKKIRSRLTELDPTNAQIKAKQGAIRTTQSSLSPLWSAFKQAAKKADSNGVQSSLASMVTLARQINEENQKIFNLETTISETLTSIQSQMP
ncbi:hypothetical protein [Paenibacillus alba]|uniref:Uncharacterized protein n=1 Tax=Paenibacillus alba TaxID=1197127 RepID=A0ABU6GB77_9BACL|nr:hypothetical protein [Paenibacillus alba]MEC0231225.1 hypothetical protein [Paenibacillus alba]